MRCPRCGSDSDRVDGDHLLFVDGPLQMVEQLVPGTNEVKVTATRWLRTVWCSSLPQTGAQPRTDPPAGGDTRQGG